MHSPVAEGVVFAVKIGMASMTVESLGFLILVTWQFKEIDPVSLSYQPVMTEIS